MHTVVIVAVLCNYILVQDQLISHCFHLVGNTLGEHRATLTRVCILRSAGGVHVVTRCQGSLLGRGGTAVTCSTARPIESALRVRCDGLWGYLFHAQNWLAAQTKILRSGKHCLVVTTKPRFRRAVSMGHGFGDLSDLSVGAYPSG